MMHMNKNKRISIWLALVLSISPLLVGCPPAQRVEQNSEEGTFLAAGNKLYSERDVFDIRDNVVYPEGKRREGLENPSTGVSDQELTMYRCTWCHECGFNEAWDWERYGSEEWAPRYVGEEWASVAERMMQKENSLLQEEQIVRRIYSYLRDETLGEYDLAADVEGAIVVEVDELPAAQAAEDSAGGT
jgi:hypothetical protein